MRYWLMKSEPDAYAWETLLKDKRTGWEGVRNYQARNNMRMMEVGDRAFFYHSNIGREIVGIMKIVKPFHPDPSDGTGKFGMVGVEPVKAFKNPVTLLQIKAHPALRKMALIRQSRLSVAPVTPEEWEILCKMGGV